MAKATIGCIGGSGLYDLDNLKFIEEVYPNTPWGYPSDKITISEAPSGLRVAFLARHGRGHVFNPSEVPARANIAALKSLGVEAILAFSAVGSLRAEIKPRDFVIPSQIIDRTKGIRPATFFENGITAHAMFADPFDATLSEIILASAANAGLKGNNLLFHHDKTLVCMEGPQFSTRAESHLYRQWGGDIINMSVLPEAKLAREAEIAYQMVCMSTDYDCWKTDEAAVTVEQVIGNLSANADNARLLLLNALEPVQKAIESGKFAHLEGSMRFSAITSKDKRPVEQVKKLEYILPGFGST